MGLRIVFFGTPQTAVPFLDVCAQIAEVPLVVSQPDKPAGRKLEVQPTPVKAAALARGLTVLQPEKPAMILEQLKAAKADLAVVVAYGRIFGQSVIESTRLGLLNVHFSLLPKYRGAAPIQWSLWKGETRSGVSLFWIDKGMDTGPMLLQKDMAVALEDDALSLEEKLVGLGADCLKAALAAIEKGDVRREPQQGEATLAPMLEKTHGAVDFAKPALEVHNQVRALVRWPTAYRELQRNGKPLRFSILKTELFPEVPGTQHPAPGTVVSIEKGRGILIQCSSGRILLQRVQPDGRKPMAAEEFANGLRLKVGDSL